MVDNENQWEDVEYSEDSGDMDYDSEDFENDEYSDEEYSDEEYESYEEDDEERGAQPQKGNAVGCIFILLLLLALIAGAVWFFFNNSANKNAQPSENVSSSQEQVAQTPVGGDGTDSTTALGDEFFAQAGGTPDDMMSVDFSNPGETTVTSTNGNEEIVATVMDVPVEEVQNEQPSDFEMANGSSGDSVDDLFPSSDLVADPSQANNEIMVAYNKKERKNPFKPPVFTKKDGYATFDNVEFEIIEPPTTSVEDENLTRLLQTQISGILYDESSPSAIVNLNGLDQFVKIGDSIAGYKIENITKDKVQITYKNNSYVASVGELFTRGALEKQRAVADLENKFAGRYRNE